MQRKSIVAFTWRTWTLFYSWLLRVRHQQYKVVYCYLFMAKMVKRMHHHFTLYAHYLSCYRLNSFVWGKPR
jgi:hypothetical protein